jgi:hypothetical protein
VACQNEIAAVSERLRDLKMHEGSISNKIMNLQSKHRTILAMDATAMAKQIQQGVVEKEAKMADLQAQMQALDQSRTVSMEQLGAVNRAGVVGGVAAGARQTSTNINNSRYDLITADTKSGLSQDPLVQTPGKGANAFEGRAVEGFASSIDNIGDRTSASPFVRPEDFIVPAERPGTANGSAKFSDWRTQTASSAGATRVAQPPGGFSSMSAIFG